MGVPWAGRLKVAAFVAAPFALGPFAVFVPFLCTVILLVLAPVLAPIVGVAMAYVVIEHVAASVPEVTKLRPRVVGGRCRLGGTGGPDNVVLVGGAWSLGT